MVDIGEIHFRALYLVAGIGVLALLRKPVRYPDRPGSKWLALTIGGLSLWLASAGLYYVARDITSALALYNLVLFAVALCFVGWLLIAIEFATREAPPRSILYGLCVFVAVHFVLLWTNYLWIHELFYGSAAFVDAGGGLNVPRGPLFWVHTVSVYLLLFVSTVLFVAEWARSSGLRRRQAGVLVITPVFGAGASLLWFAEVIPFPYDPTPVGVTAGVVLITWALYREEFLEIVPVGRQKVVAEMTDGVVILDDSDRVVDWNRSALEMFGVDDATAGMPAEAFFDPVPPETVARFAGTDQTETQVAFEMDGRERHFSVLLSTVEGSHGDAVGRIVVARDISPLKRREQQLLRQNEYLDEFAGIVSHDLQGPLMEIRGNADRAVRTGDVSHVDHVIDAVDRMEALTDDLLQLARSGQRIADTEPVDLADVASRAWRRVWAENVELVIDTDATVIADPDRVQQLLENLFRNSVEHNRPRERSHAGGDGTEPALGDDRKPAGGDERESAGGDERESADTDERVPVASEGRESLVDEEREPAGGDGASTNRLTVTVGTLEDGFYVGDDGAGIPPDERERVFDRGYSTGDGTGLGLSIVRQIAGAHGWSVRATDGPDGGARFEISRVEFD